MYSAKLWGDFQCSRRIAKPCACSPERQIWQSAASHQRVPHTFAVYSEGVLGWQRCFADRSGCGGDRASVELDLEGPWIVDVKRALSRAVAEGAFAL